jgi:hypothetical protein
MTMSLIGETFDGNDRGSARGSSAQEVHHYIYMIVGGLIVHANSRRQLADGGGATERVKACATAVVVFSKLSPR